MKKRKAVPSAARARNFVWPEIRHEIELKRDVDVAARQFQIELWADEAALHIDLILNERNAPQDHVHELLQQLADYAQTAADMLKDEIDGSELVEDRGTLN